MTFMFDQKKTRTKLDQKGEQIKMQYIRNPSYFSAFNNRITLLWKAFFSADQKCDISQMKKFRKNHKSCAPAAPLLCADRLCHTR